MNMLVIEKKYWDKNYKLIAGIDEAGRGPLAGPVVAACVILKKNDTIKGIKDSKKISSKKRELLYHEIYKHAIDIGVGIVEEDKIDKMNILEATYLAMKCAIGELGERPDIILIDGPRSNIKHYKVDHIINGDSLSKSIAAASIIAKVTRDRIMSEYDKIFPIFKFAKHKGYGTKYHIKIIKKYKAIPIHRKSFKIVKENLPTFKNFLEKKQIALLGHQLLGIQYIKKKYSILNCNINVSENRDIIDYLFNYNNDELLFVKILTVCNKKKYSIGNIDDVEYGRYIEELKKILKEKDISKVFAFNVILLTLIKNNKPNIKTIFSEKSS